MPKNTKMTHEQLLDGIARIREGSSIEAQAARFGITASPFSRRAYAVDPSLREVVRQRTLSKKMTHEQLLDAIARIRDGSSLKEQADRFGLAYASFRRRAYKLDPSLREVVAQNAQAARARTLGTVFWSSTMVLYDQEDIGPAEAARREGLTEEGFCARAIRAGVYMGPPRGKKLKAVVACYMDGADFEDLAQIFEVTRNSARRWIWYIERGDYCGA